MVTELMLAVPVVGRGTEAGAARRVHAAAAFATWQTRMEQLRAAAGKRNIVNSYVWDADGGLRVVAEESASTVEHTVGSAVSTEWGMGVDFAVNVQGFQLELNPLYQGSVTQTRALRMTQAGGKSRPWRVLHRVTQVERPALSGLGEDVRPLPELDEPPELERRLDAQDAQLGLLAEAHARLASALAKRLDELQALLAAGPAGG